MNHTDRQAAAENRRTTAYGAIEALELADARARRAAEQDPTPVNKAAAAKARRALQASWLESDRAEIEHSRTAAGEARSGWAVALSVAQLAHEVVKLWKTEHPNVVDYRVSEAAEGLRLAVKALDHLSRGKQYPEWQAAREKFIKSMGDMAL